MPNHGTNFHRHAAPCLIVVPKLIEIKTVRSSSQRPVPPMELIASMTADVVFEEFAGDVLVRLGVGPCASSRAICEHRCCSRGAIHAVPSA